MQRLNDVSIYLQMEYHQFIRGLIKKLNEEINMMTIIDAKNLLDDMNLYFPEFRFEVAFVDRNARIIYCHRHDRPNIL